MGLLPASTLHPHPQPHAESAGSLIETESEVVTIKSRIEVLKSLDEKQLEQALQQAPWGAAFVFEDIDDVVHPLGR